MKKIFILLSTALLFVGLNVKAEDTKWGDVGTPYSFGLLQDAFFIWDSGLPDGNKIIGHDDSLKSRANYLYMTKNADFPKTVTQYEATANATAKTIYLWANLVDSEGKGQNTAGYSVVNTEFPFIHVSAKDENGDTLAVYKYLRDTKNGHDSLHYISSSLDTVRVFNSNHSIYYGIDISQDSRITLTWTVTYPEGHPFEGQDLTRTTVITKSADLIKNADLKILAVHQNADSALTIENDDFWDNNLLEGFDSKTFSYSVNLEDTSYVRFEPALSKSTFTAKLNGKEVPDSIQRRGAGGLEQIRVLKSGGLLEIVVTAPNKVTKQTYKITLLPPADMPDSDKKELLGERYKSAGRLLDSLYLTDGTAKYELFNDSIGAFDGFLYGTKGIAKSDSNTFKVSVPA